jgi:SAM-dependent methyltransferase
MPLKTFRLNAAIRKLSGHSPPPESPELKALERRIAALETEIGALRRADAQATRLVQCTEIIRLEHLDFVPPPPRHLQERVVGVHSPDFIASGERTCETFAALLGKIGVQLNSFRQVLDFGCGCGRVIRAMKRHIPEGTLHGADIDAEAISWLQQNYNRFAQFQCLPHRPPSAFADDSFDFIYGISVFTHLPEDMQFEWLAELNRIASPGAVILLTTHGQKHWSQLIGAEGEQMRKQGFLYRDAGATSGLPGFYKNSYHSHGYIEQNWSRFLQIDSIIELGLENHQDVVLARPLKQAAG